MNYRDASLPHSTRVEDLLSRMTPAEMVAQLTAVYWGRTPNGTHAELPEAVLERELANGIGQVCQLGKRRTRAECAHHAHRVQRFLREQTRLGIPALIHEESLHGMIANDVTCLPTPLTLAATWNPELVEAGFAVVGEELRDAGIDLGLSPVLDLLRDARWGRAAETFGEDVTLVSAMGVAAVRGLQGRDGSRLIATGKHFAGYGASEGGHNAGPFAASRFELCSEHLVPWAAAIAEAGLGAVMPSYAAVEGQPCHGSAWLLRTLLRDRLGFIGITIADYGGVAEIADLHGCAQNNREAARLAILAGLDCELPNGECYRAHLADLMSSDPAVAAAVREAVGRTLIAKFRLGLFDRPLLEPINAGRVAAGADACAAKLADEAIVLLANPGNLLPLDAKQLRRVAVIGPNAKRVVLGPYYGSPRQCPDHVDALQAALGPEVTVVSAEGCRISGPPLAAARERNQRDPGKDHSLAHLSTPEDDAPAIAEAAELARSCDVVVLVLGDDFTTTRESFRATPAGDRADLSLPGAQRALLAAIKATAVPMVVVLNRMGVIADPELMDGRVALLDAGCLGQDQGLAVARVLLGQVEPGGRLAHTVPRSAGHLPCHGSAAKAARRGYGHDSNQPLYPFGFGLSYTSIRLESCSLVTDQLPLGEAARLRVRVHNHGTRPGSEVVQVYQNDVIASRTRSARELAAFAKVRLAPGESCDLELSVPAQRLGWRDENGHLRQEPGEHRLWVTTGAAPGGGEVLTLHVD